MFTDRDGLGCCGISGRRSLSLARPQVSSDSSANLSIFQNLLVSYDTQMCYPGARNHLTGGQQGGSCQSPKPLDASTRTVLQRSLKQSSTEGGIASRYSALGATVWSCGEGRETVVMVGERYTLWPARSAVSNIVRGMEGTSGRRRANPISRHALCVF